MGALPLTPTASTSSAVLAASVHSASSCQCERTLCSLRLTASAAATEANKVATSRLAREVGPLLLVLVTIASVAYIALFDTGSAISTINLSALARLPDVPVVHKCDHIEIKAWNGASSPCPGMIHITMHNRKDPSAFIVSPTSQFNFIIGNNIIAPLGAYTVTESAVTFTELSPPLILPCYMRPDPFSPPVPVANMPSELPSSCCTSAAGVCRCTSTPGGTFGVPGISAPSLGRDGAVLGSPGGGMASPTPSAPAPLSLAAQQAAALDVLHSSVLRSDPSATDFRRVHLMPAAGARHAPAGHGCTPVSDHTTADAALLQPAHVPDAALSQPACAADAALLQLAPPPPLCTPVLAAMAEALATLEKAAEAPTGTAAAGSPPPVLTSAPVPEPFVVHGCKQHRAQAQAKCYRCATSAVAAATAAVAFEKAIERATRSGRVSRLTKTAEFVYSK